MKGIAAAVACVALLGCAQPASASAWQFDRFYLGLAAGTLIPEDTDQQVSGAALGLPVSANGTMRYRPGVVLDALIGYQLGDHVSAELTLGWARYAYERISGTLTAGPMTLHGGVVDGHVRYWTGFANAIVNPWGRTRFSPYLGVGIGLTDYVADLRSVATETLGKVALDSRTGNRDLALNGIVGVSYAVSPSVSLGARYRHLWTDSARTVTSGGLTGRSSNAAHHTLSASFIYRL